MEQFNTTWMSLTYNCNNKCKWCYAASNFQDNGLKSFNSEKEQETINLLSELGIKKIILIGGEPTLYKNIYSILDKTLNKGIPTGMVTNGRRLKDINFTRELKKRGLDYVTISVEGANAFEHDSITQIQGSYNDTIKGIKNSLSEGINISTNTVISSENINGLEGIISSLKKVGVKEMGFNICGVCVSEEDNNSYIINPKKASNAFAEVYKKFKDEKIKLKLITPVPFCFFDKEMLKEFVEKDIISGGPCQLVHGRNFVIDYNGDIVPCTHLTGFPLFNLFQDEKIITKEDFISLYNQESISKLRKEIGRYPSEKCDSCDESCSGGCPLFWMKFKPEEEI